MRISDKSNGNEEIEELLCRIWLIIIVAFSHVQERWFVKFLGSMCIWNLCYAIATVKDMNIAKDIQSLLDRLSYEYIDMKIFRYVESNVCWRKEHDTNGIPMKTYLSHFLIVHGR